MRNINKIGALVLLGAASAYNAVAQTTPVDYGEVLEDNLSTINGIWGTVATIMVAVALVTVGVRFFRKAR